TTLCTTLCVLFCLILHSHHHHRSLHSFPTRRSSDLFSRTVSVLDPASNTVLHVIPVTGDPFGVRVAPGDSVLWVTTNADSVYARSEEHTSELQSRRDLVCRLLLEKKKQKGRSDNGHN